MEFKQNDDFSSIHIYKMIWNHKFLILSVTLIASIISGVIAVMYIKNEYKSTVNAVPPQNTGSMDGAMGALSGALKDIGLSKLGGSGGETYNFIVILDSRSVKDSIIKEFNLAKVYDIPDTSISLIHGKFNENLEINYERDGNYFISIWDTDKNRAAEMANRYIEITNELAIKIYREEVALNRKNMEERLFKTDSIIKAVSDTLEKFSRRTMMFYPTEQASAVSKSLADMKSEEFKYDMMYDYYSKLYGADDYMTQSVKGLKEKVTEKINDVNTKPGFVGNFALKDAAGEGIEFMRLYAELETYTKVKAFMLPMMEKSRLDETKLMKSLIVIDKAIPADKKDRPKRSLIVAGTAAGTFSLMIFILLIINTIRTLNRKIIIKSGE